MAFYRGQRVVCVSTTGHYAPWIPIPGLDGLRERAVYTIRDIGEYRGIPMVWIEEITRRTDPGHPEAGEAGYAPCRFRPVVSKSTEAGMAQLKSLLHKAPEKVA